MSNGILAPIGRTGVIGAVKNLTGMPVTGYRAVDPSATFVAGQLAKLGTVNGVPMVQAVSATSDKPIGIFYTDNTTTFYRPSYLEAHTFGENVSAPTQVYTKPYVKTASYVVMNSTYTQLTETTNYTIDTTNGIITNVNLAATAVIYVNYLYKDVNLSGINQTIGSGMAALLEEAGEISTLMYDTVATTAYALNDTIYFTSGGLLTKASSGSAAIGRVTKAPTASDPELHVKISLV